MKVSQKISGVVVMVQRINTSSELLDQIKKMDKDNSVCEVFLPGKGKFTIVLQEEDQQSVLSDIQSDQELQKMIHESREAYKKGNAMTTSELLKSISLKDFTIE